MMRWQTVYLCSGLKDVLTNCLLLHLTNGHSSQNEWSQNFPVKAHLHNTYCVIITCNVSWSFRGAVSEELRWQSVQKAQNSKKNNDCYSILFSMFKMTLLKMYSFNNFYMNSIFIGIFSKYFLKMRWLSN